MARRSLPEPKEETKEETKEENLGGAQETFWQNDDGSIQVEIKKDHTYKLVYTAEKLDGAKRKQICQSFVVELYKEEADEIRSMCDLAADYDKKLIKKGELYAHRDARSADCLRDPAKRGASAKVAMKRPARAPTPPPAEANDSEGFRTPPPTVRKRHRGAALEFSFGPEAAWGMTDHA